MSKEIRRSLVDGKYMVMAKRIVFLAVILILLLVPFLLRDSPYMLHTAILTCIFIALATSFNLLWGYTGLLSLGHTAFFGIGAYVTALLTAHHATLPAWIEFPAAGLVTGIIAFCVSIPALRMAKTSFVMVTLAFLVVAQVINSNWVSLTNGAVGISNIPGFWIALPGLPDIHLESRASNYYFALVFAALVILFVSRLVRSRIGKVLVAIREDEILAKTFGVATFKYKLVAFIAAGVLAGLTGSVYAHYISFVGPSVFDFPFLSRLLIIVIAGGTGSLGGVIGGAILFTIVPEILRMANEFREIVFGIVVLLFVIYMPGGLAGLWVTLRLLVRRKLGAPTRNT